MSIGKIFLLLQYGDQLLDRTERRVILTRRRFQKVGMCFICTDTIVHLHHQLNCSCTIVTTKVMKRINMVTMLMALVHQEVQNVTLMETTLA